MRVFVFILVLAIAAVIALSVALKQSSMGRRIRAVVQNRDLAETSGISSRRTDITTFFLGSGLFDMARAMTLEPLSQIELSPRHDRSVTSVSLRETRPVDLERFRNWLGELLASQGQDILRTKGVLADRRSTQRFVFHGVHMLSEMSWGMPWREDEARESKLVFIGRGLDAEALRAGFAGCLAEGGRPAGGPEQLNDSVGAADRAEVA